MAVSQSKSPWHQRPKFIAGAAIFAAVQALVTGGIPTTAQAQEPAVKPAVDSSKPSESGEKKSEESDDSLLPAENNGEAQAQDAAAKAPAGKVAEANSKKSAAKKSKVLSKGLRGRFSCKQSRALARFL